MFEREQRVGQGGDVTDGTGEARGRDLADRLTRLEESLAFAAHDADQLGAHVRALMAAIDALARRVERLEARLARLEHPGTDEPGTA